MGEKRKFLYEKQLEKKSDVGEQTSLSEVYNVLLDILEQLKKNGGA